MRRIHKLNKVQPFLNHQFFKDFFSFLRSTHSQKEPDLESARDNRRKLPNRGCPRFQLGNCSRHKSSLPLRKLIALNIFWVNKLRAPCMFSVKGQCEASNVSGKQVGDWQLNSKTEKSFHCVLAKATW